MKGLIIVLTSFVTFRASAFPASARLRHAVRRRNAAATHPAAVRTFAVSPSTEEDVDVLTASSNVAPDMEAYAAGYSTVFEELPCAVCSASQGKIPDDLTGTYFRSGPAMFSAGSIPPPKTSAVQPKGPPIPDGKDENRMVKHPFEGDGAILAVTFPGDGKAVTRFRYVRTNAFTNERRKGVRMYTAMDSTRDEGSSAGAGQGNDFPLPLFRHHLQTGLNKKRKNTSNTRAVYWGKKLITLWEGGLPYKLDSLALSTEGRSQLGGVLKADSPFGAKAAYDSNLDRMLFYSNRQDSKSSDLTVYEFNSKFRLVSEKGGKVEAELPGFALLSDFAVTKNYALFVQPPVTTNGMQFMLSKEPGKTLSLDKAPSMLHLIPRVGASKQGEMRTLPIPVDDISDADLQFINAYEDDDGTVIIDAIRSDGKNTNGKATSWPWASSLADFAKIASKKSLWRYTVSPRDGSISKQCISDVQASFGVVNPAVSAQKHKYVYASVGSLGAAVAPPQGIAKFDCESGTSEVWLPKEFEFCGEPMYAPRKTDGGAEVAEDDGYLMSVLFNGKSKESEMVILLASDITSGPVARVKLGLGVPHGFYGCFGASEETGWNAEEIDRRAKLADKMEGRGNMWNEVKSDFSGLGLRLDDFEEYFGDLL